MTVEKLLNAVGKAIFIKYYYSFRNKSRDCCIGHFEEDFTDKSKSSRTGHAQSIFRSGLERDALTLIANSNRIDESICLKAKEIISKDF